jgi:hypothetical protein
MSFRQPVGFSFREDPGGVGCGPVCMAPGHVLTPISESLVVRRCGRGVYAVDHAFKRTAHSRKYSFDGTESTQARKILRRSICDIRGETPRNLVNT